MILFGTAFVVGVQPFKSRLTNINTVINFLTSMSVIYAQVCIKDGLADEEGEDWIGWWIIISLVGNLIYHLSFIFVSFIVSIIGACVGFYYDYYRVQKEKKHIENLEEIDSFFKGALVGIKAYVTQYRENKKVKSW